MKTLIKFAKLCKSSTLATRSINVTYATMEAYHSKSKVYLALKNEGNLAPGVYYPDGFNEKPLKSDFDEADFPVVTWDDSDTLTTELPRATFLADLEFTSRTMSGDSTRYFLNGVFLQNKTMVALDGHRLHSVTYAETIAAKGAGVIAPDLWVKTAIDLMKEYKVESTITLITGENYISLSIGSAVVTARPIDGTFPQYQKVIPPNKGMYYAGHVQQKDIKAALKRAKTIAKAKEIRYRVIPLIFENEGITLPYLDDPETMPLGLNIKQRVAFNGAYLADIGDGHLLLNHDTQAPCLITHSNRLAVFMPYRR